MTAATTVDTGLKRRFEAGDGLRAIFVVFVLLAHAGKTTANLNPDASFARILGEGGHAIRSFELSIYMFFALSGYLIARPFVSSLVTGRELPSLARYTRSRALRIIPALWVVWTITLLVDGTRGSSATEILAVYAFAQTYDPSAASWLLIQAWTLDIEMAFYILLPLTALGVSLVVRRLPPGKPRAIWLLAGIAAMAVISMAIRVKWNDPAWSSKIPEFLVAFAPGMALAVIEPVWAWRALGSQTARRAASVMMALGWAVFFACALAPTGPPWHITAWGVPMGALIVAGALVREWTGAPAFRAFVHPVIIWLGERSYGLYLVHLLILRQLARMIGGFESTWLAFAVVAALLVPISSAAAALSWRFVERPAMRLARRRRTVPQPFPEPIPSQAK